MEHTVRTHTLVTLLVTDRINEERCSVDYEE